MAFSIKQKVARNLRSVYGWKTKRKILVMESDDWGSIRMPSLQVWDAFVQKGFDLKDSTYNRWDSLESNEDLEQLFEVLCQFRDQNGNPPVITANCLVANPDFEKIKQSSFRQYHYEKLPETLKKYPGRDRVLDLWKEGIKNKIFHPQFHGREHLNVQKWMSLLQQGDEKVLYSFAHGVAYSGQGDYNFMASLDMDSAGEISQQEEILKDGLNIFEELLGYRSRSFIAPCYVWHSRLEETLKQAGVQYLQGGNHQFEPTGKPGELKNIKHYTGQKNKAGQTYLVRNCSFEPSLIRKSDWIEDTLYSIQTCFRWGNPAILSTHRVNFIGALHPKNRNENLKQLRQLLAAVLKKWPDIEFMTSDQLGAVIQ